MGDRGIEGKEVVLLSDTSYEKLHVTSALRSVVEKMTEDQATQIFNAAQLVGSAVITKADDETSEFIVTELGRKTPMIYAEVRDADSNDDPFSL